MIAIRQALLLTHPVVPVLLMGKMLSLGPNQLSSRWSVKVWAGFTLLCLVSWYMVPWTSSGANAVSWFSSAGPNGAIKLDSTILQPSITPIQTKFPPWGESLNLQLPPHAARRWAILHKVMGHYDPGSPLESGFENADMKELYAESWETCERPDIVNLRAHDVAQARKSHTAFVKTLPALAAAFSWQRNTRGIVVTADGALMPVLVVSLRLLRRTGCTLPVEVFIPKFADYEPKLCEKVLPSLNARCVMLADDLLNVAAPEGQQELAAYQIKPFVLLMSSFEQVMFLDADNFPVIDPEKLFESDPFLETGLVIWPDLWCASQSPFFYKITGGIEPPVQDRPGSESGQVMYDKRRHVQDLLLACYYGYYGPGLWYPLLSQGFPGEGDKETYLAAAEFLNATFYQVRQPPGMLAHEEAVDFAIQQVNPADDFAAMKEGQNWSELDLPHAFIHHHYPRLNALSMMNTEFEWAEEEEGHSRMWGSKAKTVALYGLDLEHEVWKAINYTACGLEGMFETWRGNSSCKFVQEYMQTVFGAAVDGKDGGGGGDVDDFKMSSIA